jgi:peroxiredoxin
MSIEPGQRLPDGEFLVKGDDGIAPVTAAALAGTGRTVFFGLPGAYTGVCSTAHVPSFVRAMPALRAKGVTGVYCVTVNDPHVTKAWAEVTGATAAGITVLADADGAFTKALGMDFTNPKSGFYGRSKRYSMLVENGVVTLFNLEENPGQCALSSGEAMAEQIDAA